MEYSVGIIGSGNVAWHFGHAIKKAGHKIKYVSGRNKNTVPTLAAQLNADAMPIKANLKPVDIVVVALSDSIIYDVINIVKPASGIYVHTSGSLPLNIFGRFVDDYGVIYPFQSLTKEIKTDVKETPLCIEASNDKTMSVIQDLSSSISNRVHELGSDKRKYLHLAGVLANNFTNYVYSLSYKMLKDRGLNPHLMEPLIVETANKVLNKNPDEMQTGPARRNNQNIIKLHLELLNEYPEIHQLYSLISEQIVEKYNE
ncbi:MAG: F420-dependent NADP oxidoreductase [Bacteroidales bacterium]|nr:F420-dependent NADP oxidoreductase [Bacteroidales bacterium]